MPKQRGDYLAKRQQEIMEIVYRRGQADVAAVMEDLSDPLTNPAVRAHLRALEEGGHLKHTEEAGRFVYQPTKPRQTAARSALMGLLHNFFNDSVEGVMSTLLSAKASDLTEGDIERLQTLLDQVKAPKSTDEGQAQDA
jgi:BlaI family penicillinase repressor